MTTYFPAKKGVEYIFYVGLVSQANTKVLQSSPTIAAGDFKVSIDGAALANPATLPAVTPASSKMVKITLSTSEMNGDNITVICSDASGAEWCDLIINIQTTARQIDDLAWPTTSGRSILVDASGKVSLPSTEHDNIADALLKRDWTSVTGEAARSALNALRFLRNKWTVSAGTLTVTEEDDTATAWTAAVSTTAGDPASGVDPT